MPESTITPIAREVQDLEREYARLNQEMLEVRRILMDNFGPQGRIKPLIDRDHSTPKMIYTVMADLSK